MFLMERCGQLFIPLLQAVRGLLDPVVLLPILTITIILIRRNKEYKKSAYYQITRLAYGTVRGDKGRYGEYLIYKLLKNHEMNGAKFLFNVYIPKDDGKTTEIDVLMVCSKGLFVFESKNYSGWIFGSEEQKNWYQTLPKSRRKSHKKQFYNPIMQNRSHIKHLKALLGEQIPMHSVIVFSDRCTLKKMQITSECIRVINRHRVASTVSDLCNQASILISESDMENMYNKLYPYAQVDDDIRKQHIENVSRKEPL